MVVITLQKKLEINDLSLDSLAKRVKCSRSVLSKFFTKHEIIDFDIVLNIVKLLTPDQEKSLMFDYCKEINRPNQLKCAFEYASIHSNVNLLKYLLDKFRSHRNKEVQELVYFYQLLFDRLSGEKNYIDVFKEMMDTEPSTTELFVLKLIMEMHYFYQHKSFHDIERLANEFTERISGVKSDFVRRSFTIRCNQMTAYLSLHIHNDVDKAREISFESIECELGTSTNGFFYNIIATSFFNESIDKMNYYATKSVGAYEKIYGTKCAAVDDLINRFHKLNIIMTNNLTLDLPKDKDDPLDLYIEGKYHNDIQKMIECLVELTKKGNLFFAKMTVEELMRMGCNESLIKSIQSINS